MELGVLYAYGLGVAKDPQRAQQLWSDSTEVAPGLRPGGSALIRLMKHDALPKTMDDWNSFQQEVTTVNARMEEKEAQEREIAEQKRAREEAAAQAKYNREHPEAARAAREQSTGSTTRSHDDCSMHDWSIGSHAGMFGGMWLASGCH